MDAQDTPRIITPIPRELLRAIEDYKFANRMNSRAEAMRSLLEFALQCYAHGYAPFGDDDKAPYDPGPRQKEKA